MASTDHQFTYLCRAMGRPELAEDARYRSNAERMVRVEELTRLIQEWFDSMPNDEEIFRLFDEHRVPYAPVLTIEQAMAHPHLRERGLVRKINDAPTLGEDNELVLREYLGYPPQRIRELEAAGVLHRGVR
jgi:CoA:oxalate CoA-transferase